MACKNISLREEAYLFLKGEKRGNESFSDVIVRLAQEQKGTWARLEKHAGIWNDLEADEPKHL